MISRGKEIQDGNLARRRHGTSQETSDGQFSREVVLSSKAQQETMRGERPSSLVNITSKSLPTSCQAPASDTTKRKMFQNQHQRNLCLQELGHSSFRSDKSSPRSLRSRSA